jgi:hypothetical protein
VAGRAREHSHHLSEALDRPVDCSFASLFFPHVDDLWSLTEVSQMYDRQDRLHPP